MKASHFVQKRSVQFVSANGKLSAPFYFWDNKPHECSQTWQVERGEFDQMLLENAREHGVDAREGVHVLEVIFEGERAVGVKIQEPDGTRREVRAPVVVDASGQAAHADEPLRPAHLGSAAQQGRDLDLLRGRGQGRQPRRGRHAGRADARQARLVVEHPAARRSPQLRHRPAVRGHLQEPRRRSSRPTSRRSSSTPYIKHRVGNAKRITGYFATRDYSYRVARAGRRRLGAWSATPSASSIRSTRRA